MKFVPYKLILRNLKQLKINCLFLRTLKQLKRNTKKGSYHNDQYLFKRDGNHYNLRTFFYFF